MSSVTSILSVIVVFLLLSPPQNKVLLLGITQLSDKAQGYLGELAPWDPVRGQALSRPMQLGF